MQMSAGEATDEQSSAVNGHYASIRPLCLELAARVNAFLHSEAETPVLKAVQEQTRVALGVISEALDRYRYFGTKCLLHILYIQELRANLSY
jgi:FAD synthetase